MITFWNYRTGRSLKTFEANDSEVSALGFTPDGKQLVVGTWKGVLRVFDIAAGKMVREIDLDTPIYSLAASMEHIAVGYGDGTVAVLNFSEQSSIPELKKQNGAIMCIAFSPKGDRFVCGSADGAVGVWDAKTLQLLGGQEGRGLKVLSVVFGPDGREIVAADTSGMVRSWRE